MLKISESEAELIISCLLIDEEGENRRENLIDNGAHNICEKIMDLGECHSLFLHLVEEDVKFFQYVHMTHEKFTVFLVLLKSDVSRENASSNASEKLPFRRILIGFFRAHFVRCETVKAHTLKVSK
jgi:hypothetical protein